MIDLLSARKIVESKIHNIPGVTGTGVSFGDKNIIIYVKNYNAEIEVRNAIKGQHQFPLKFVISGNIITFQ